MASGEVVLQSMWSPAVTAVRSRGIPCYYVPLKEGYRAWAQLHARRWRTSTASSSTPPTSTSTGTSPAGRAAFIAKQGYYTSVPGDRQGSS